EAELALPGLHVDGIAGLRLRQVGERSSERRAAPEDERSPLLTWQRRVPAMPRAGVEVARGGALDHRNLVEPEAGNRQHRDRNARGDLARYWLGPLRDLGAECGLQHTLGPVLLDGAEHGEIREAPRGENAQAQQARDDDRSEEHTSELQSRVDLVCR